MNADIFMGTGKVLLTIISAAIVYALCHTSLQWDTSAAAAMAGVWIFLAFFVCLIVGDDSEADTTMTLFYQLVTLMMLLEGSLFTASVSWQVLLLGAVAFATVSFVTAASCTGMSAVRYWSPLWPFVGPSAIALVLLPVFEGYRLSGWGTAIFILSIAIYLVALVWKNTPIRSS